SDHVAPPLMRHFMKWNQVMKMFLPGFGEAGALLGISRKERIRGKIQKARPTLTKSSGNLRNAQLMERNRPGKVLVEVNRGIDVARQCFESVGRTRWRHLQAQMVAALRTDGTG